MDNNDPMNLCGLGVFIQNDTPLGATYGYSGWIPGYRSNLQYYPEYDFSIAFQIIADYGFEGDAVQVFDELKWSLAKIVVHVLTGKSGFER